MKPLFVIFFAVLAANPGIAQTKQSILDSLKKELVYEKQDTNKVLLLAELADKYGFVQPDSSFYYARQTLELSQKLDYRYGRYLGYRNLYFAFFTLSDYPKVLETEFKALSIAEQLPNRRQSSMSSVHMLLGFVYRGMGEYTKALAHHWEAERLHLAAGEPLATIHSSFNTPTQVYLNLNRLDSALWYSKKVCEIGRQSKTLAAIDLAIMGNVYEALGNNEFAENYYRMGVALSINDGDSYFRARLYNNLANLFHKAGSDSSIYFAKQALQICRENKFLNYQLNSAQILARIYESQGKPDSTVKYLKMTMATSDSIFGQSRIRQFQTTQFSEDQRQQELKIANERLQSQLKLYVLLGTLGIFLILAFILYRNNIHKQRANVLLETQKNEIDRQRSVAEKAFGELKATQSQLIQSEKMASLGELTAGIAHEIQNPLNFVNNFSEVNTELINEMVDEAEKGNTKEVKSIAHDIKQNLEKINHHGKRADSIVKGMLQHSRTSSGQKEPTDINALCDEYLRLAYHGLRAKDKSFNAKIESSLDPSIGKTNIIPQDIGRAVLNLINNAFYAVNEKKKTVNKGYEPTVTVKTKKANDSIQISVADNGNGIPQLLIEKIFQPFFTTKPTGQGTGLGLSLAYDIVKAHGGELKVETEESEGSMFIIHLPLQS